MTQIDDLLERIEKRSADVLALVSAVLFGTRPPRFWSTIVSHVEEMQRDIREAKAHFLAEEGHPCPGCRKPISECEGTHVGCKRPRT